MFFIIDTLLCINGYAINESPIGVVIVELRTSWVVGVPWRVTVLHIIGIDSVTYTPAIGATFGGCTSATTIMDGVLLSTSWLAVVLCGVEKNLVFIKNTSWTKKLPFMLVDHEEDTVNRWSRVLEKNL